MAKGGSMKGHMQSHSRGRTTYAVLLLLAFGVAIFGVIILHKLRERRIFNLLVKDKQIELIHVKLLLQVLSLSFSSVCMCVSCQLHVQDSNQKSLIKDEEVFITPPRL